VRYDIKRIVAEMYVPAFTASVLFFSTLIIYYITRNLSYSVISGIIISFLSLFFIKSRIGSLLMK